MCEERHVPPPRRGPVLRNVETSDETNHQGVEICTQHAFSYFEAARKDFQTFGDWEKRWRLGVEMIPGKEVCIGRGCSCAGNVKFGSNSATVVRIQNLELASGKDWPAATGKMNSLGLDAVMMEKRAPLTSTRRNPVSLGGDVLQASMC